MKLAHIIFLLAYGQWQRLIIWQQWDLIQMQQVILDSMRRHE